MMDWLRFLYKYPQAFLKVHSEDDNSICRNIKNANDEINKIGEMISNQSEELEVSKQLIERKLL
jgi:hypothetical protein